MKAEAFSVDSKHAALAAARQVSTRTKLRFLKSSACPTVACYPLLSLDRAMEQAGLAFILHPQNKRALFLSKVISKLRLVRNVARSTQGPVFVAFMGFSESKIVPFSCWTEIVPYCFDCWPNSYRRWRSFFQRQRVRVAFFSARQSAEYFVNTLPSMKSIWLPEATDPSEYDPAKSWAERDIDVLELGRKNDQYHVKIVRLLEEAKKRHLFERVKGEIIFPNRAGLIDGLGRSKISICFPCSLTHPDRSGSVETVTHRYFESIASRCLILGHAPQELIDLFGYNPVVEIEENDEFRQILFILENFSSFEALVDQNYRRLLEVGTWGHRVQRIIDVVHKLLPGSAADLASELVP